MAFFLSVIFYKYLFFMAILFIFDDGLLIAAYCELTKCE
ncbi:hypothetical protein GARC_4379 [Paraglaciecola arctica BSs20135]|uniref:Uncharacterized protein n=1 Tax=Paraglaciecola arctica BSs20135 TaxID=493475 RepID=K6YBM6_9ALTE|nr:hypothetical protein GARC_4379 [Paraglaciecola arctica BSs20135]